MSRDHGEIIDELMETLIEEKVLYVDGIDEEGEFIYKIDVDRMQEYDPELFKIFFEDTMKEIDSLIEKGFLKAEFDDKQMDHVYSLTEAGEEALNELGRNGSEWG